MILPQGINGDTAITWQEQNDAILLPAIEALMKRGYLFSKLQEGAVIAVTSTSHLGGRTVTIPDETLAQMHADGVLAIGGVTLQDESGAQMELARTPEEVVAADTVVTPPMKGG
jgi:hypothetical protein